LEAIHYSCQEAITLFFMTDVSMAGCQGWYYAPAPMLTRSRPTEATSPALPSAIENDEELSWPGEPYFRGNEF
jgi:hypothetical protein